MRVQIAVLTMLAGGLAACAGTPPPRPMAAVEAPPPPAPAPAPMPVAPVDGAYRGQVVSSDDSGPRCRKLPATASTRVRGNSFLLAGMRGRIGPDGAVTAPPHGGSTMTGTLANGMLDVTTMRRGCGYHYTLSHG